MHIRRRAGFRSSRSGAMEIGIASALQQIIEREIVARAVLVALLGVDLLQAEKIGVKRIEHRAKSGAAARKGFRMTGRPVEMFEIEGR